MPQRPPTAHSKLFALRDSGRLSQWHRDCKLVDTATAGGLVSLEEEARRERIERRVLEYAVNRPAAKDTIEGIRLWWLREEADVSYTSLREALAALVAKNWLAVRSIAPDDGEQANVYGLNATEIGAIRSYLAQPPFTGEEGGNG